MKVLQYGRGFSRRKFLADAAAGVLSTGVLMPLSKAIAQTGDIGNAYPDELLSIEGYTKGRISTGDTIDASNVELVKDLMEPVRYEQILNSGRRLKVGKTTARSFAGRIQELVKGHPHLEAVSEALLSVRTVLLREFNAFEKRVRAMARSDARTRLLMSTPAVGPIVALTYASAIDDPARFKSSKQTGPHFGLTPKKYQSGETDYSGRISKIGDASVREALYQAAHVMLTKPVKGCSQLKSWAMRIVKRAGKSKAKVALARKLAVILHRMLANGKPFNAAASAA